VGRVKAFLDANVLFSAALGGEGFGLLWGLAERGAVELVTSSYCYLEARVNLERKAPAAIGRLGERMRVVGLVGPVPSTPHGRSRCSPKRTPPCSPPRAPRARMCCLPVICAISAP